MTEPTDDLQQRCAECIEWQQTGELRQGALRAYADKHWHGYHDSLQMAERATETQAMEAVARWGTQAQAVAIPLTDREIELIDGMIQVQLDYASRCDAIANRSMADKQKGWDMERVALLQKFKAHGIKGGQHGTE